jgi:hypothetical protein
MYVCMYIYIRMYVCMYVYIYIRYGVEALAAGRNLVLSLLALLVQQYEY